MLRPAYITEFERYRRQLPHHEEPGATYFLTICLVRPAPVDLTAPDLACLVVEALEFYDGNSYYLYEYTVMPDHLHMLLKPTTEDGKTHSVSRIVYRLKHWLSRQINEAANREGDLWQRESYDHVIRNGNDYLEKANYIFFNAHKAGLVDDPAEWRWWGVGSGMREM